MSEIPLGPCYVRLALIFRDYVCENSSEENSTLAYRMCKTQIEVQTIKVPTQVFSGCWRQLFPLHKEKYFESGLL